MYKKIIDRAKRIESSLVQMGAEGRGLHEKVTSIESRLSSDLVKKIRFIASIRNQLLHDQNFDLSGDLESDFLLACDEADEDLASISFNQKSSNCSSLTSGSRSTESDISLKEPPSNLEIIGVLEALAAMVWTFWKS